MIERDFLKGWTLPFKRYTAALVCCLAVCCAVRCEAFAGDLQGVKRHLSYRFLLRNETDRVVPRAKFRTYAPFLRTGAQQRTSLNASFPFEVVTDEAGNQILQAVFEDIPPYGVKMLTIEADLLLLEAPQSENPTIDTPEIVNPERFCESDDPSIVALAGQLQGANDLKTAENIFHWVANNIRYSGYLAQPRGARYALTQKRGDCTEFMYLFVALCRAAGVPARGLGGYVVPRNMALDPAAYHNWAEFYAGGRWRLADPQQNMFDRNQTQYIVMRRLRESADSFRRFQVEGDGIRVEMRK